MRFANSNRSETNVCIRLEADANYKTIKKLTSFAELGSHMKNANSPEIFLSHSIICSSKRLDGSRNHFKQAIMGLIKGGHAVAAYEESTDKPTIIFRDSASFDYWYENFVRIQGWIMPDMDQDPGDDDDYRDYFNCSNVE